MKGDWQQVMLECPVCRRPVEVCVDALMAKQRQCCSAGHALPQIDLGATGLNEAIMMLDGVLRSLERLRPASLAR